MKLQPSLVASLIVLAGISTASVARAATTAVYNPATGVVTVQGVAVTQTVTVTAPSSGTFTYNNTSLPYGTATFNLQCAGSISVKIGDAVLGELPSGWTFSSGSYVVEGSGGGTGPVTETSVPGYTTDTGFVSALGEALTDFSTVSDLATTVQYSVPSSPSPVGVVLKGVLVARAAYTCASTPVVTIGTLSSQPALNFPAITSAADPSNVTTVTLATPAPALPPWGAGLLATLLAGVALVVCRRAPSATCAT